MLVSQAQIILITTMSGVLCSPIALTDTLGFWSPTPAQVEIADRLDSFESTAVSTRSEIDLYAAAVRSGNLHLQSYIGDLEQIKEHVNLLGKKLAELERRHTQGTELEQAAIREARPHLEALANRVQITLLMLSEDRRCYNSSRFREAVKGMYQEADSLYNRVDAITDYEKARYRAINSAPGAKDDL
jgi:hypothetical protein